MASENDVPQVEEMILLSLRAIDILGDNPGRRLIALEIIRLSSLPTEIDTVTPPDGKKPIFYSRLDWALNHCKLAGAIDGTGTIGPFHLLPLGRQIVSLPEDEAQIWAQEIASEIQEADDSNESGEGGVSDAVEVLLDEATEIAAESDTETASEAESEAGVPDAPDFPAAPDDVPPRNEEVGEADPGAPDDVVPTNDDVDATRREEQLPERPYESPSTALESVILSFSEFVRSFFRLVLSLLQTVLSIFRSGTRTHR